MKHPLLVSKGNKPRTGRVVKCANCGKETYLRPSSLRTNNYCSVWCHDQHQVKGRPMICKVCGKEYYRPPSQVRLRGSSFCSRVCMGKSLSISQRGDKNSQWKNGISTENHRLRASKRWKVWREAVFTRDNYACQDCGARNGNGKAVFLHPHHIKSFTHYPELRFEISNGITLCDNCHKRHTSWQTLRRRRRKVESKNLPFG